jgi:DNA-binding transcriptional ArsR family regulator
MAVEQRRSQVHDLSRPGAVGVEVDVAEAAEVLMSMTALLDDDDDTYDLGAERLAHARAAITPELAAAIDELSLRAEKLPAYLLGVVHETPAPRSFAAFLERLGTLEPIELKLHLLGYHGAGHHLVPPETIRAAAGGNEAAVAEFLAALAEYDVKQELARNLLELDATRVKARLLELLPRWYEEVFLPHSEGWREAAERDAEVKRKLAPTHTPEQLVELATNGYQYSPGQGVRTLVFFPSWWMRPWVILWEHKAAKIFCYPIRIDSDESGTSPAELARLYKALGDEGRLRLLRRLAAGSLRLTEAAAELGVAKSTAHHHLAILRHAGLVTIRDEEENVYSLRRDVIPQAGALLESFLG